MKKFALLFGLLGLLVTAGAASADKHHVIVVKPNKQHGWTTADTRPGGAVNFVSDSTAPRGKGALELTTDLTTTAKAQYLHDTKTPLAQVTELSYWTKQIVPPSAPAVADPSYQLAMCLNGVTGTTCNGFTTLVYEPYQGGQGAVLPNVWQFWNIDSTGLFWSTRTVTCGSNVVAGTSGGPAIYTITQVKAACPDAVVVQYGVNIGSNNPGYIVRTDLFDFNGTVYDFESGHGHNSDQGDDDDQGENGDD